MHEVTIPVSTLTELSSWCIDNEIGYHKIIKSIKYSHYNTFLLTLQFENEEDAVLAKLTFNCPQKNP